MKVPKLARGASASPVESWGVATPTFVYCNTDGVDTALGETVSHHVADAGVSVFQPQFLS